MFNMNFSDQHIDEAIEWHLRLKDDDADWAAFTRWLEADEAHRHAYDFVAVNDLEIDRYLPQISVRLPANDDVPVAKNQRGFWAAGMAACLALLGVTTYLNPFSNTPETLLVETAIGEQQTIALADGVSVQVAANSSLKIVKGDVAHVTLEKGAAYFAAPADPAASFAVQVGNYQVRDIGTQFGVSRGSGVVTLTVADGAVAVSSDTVSELKLRAGRGLQISEKDQKSRIFSVSKESVAGWRSGSLVYENTPIQTVAADIERTIGIPIMLDPTLAEKSFSGILKIGNGSKLVDDFSRITGIKAEKRDNAIYFNSAP